MHRASFKTRRKNNLSALAMILLLGCLSVPSGYGQTTVWERSLQSELQSAQQLLLEEKDPRAALNLLEQVPRFFPLLTDSSTAARQRILYAELIVLGLQNAQFGCDTLPDKIEQALFRAGWNYQRGDWLKETFWKEKINLQPTKPWGAHFLALSLLRDFSYCSTGPIDSVRTILSRVWKQKIDEHWDLPFWASPLESPEIVTSSAGLYYDAWINHRVKMWLQSPGSNLEEIYQILEEREERLRQSQLRWLEFRDIYPKEKDPLPALRSALYSADSLDARIQRDQAILKADSLGLLRDLLAEQRAANEASIRNIQTKYPRFVSFWENAAAPSLKSLQNGLVDESETFLRYYQLEGAVFVLIVGQDQVQYVYSEISSDFNKYLATLNQSIRQEPGPSVTEFLNNGLAVYQDLFAPVDSFLSNNTKELVVALPHRKNVPMEVLLEREPGLNDLLPAWAFLVKRFSFRYTPSCKQWLEEITKETAKPTDRFGGFSWDPALDINGDSIIAWSEMAQGGKVQFTRQQRDVVDLGSAFAGDLFLGPEATLANFQQRLNDYQVLHLALPWREEGQDLYWDEGVHFMGHKQDVLSARTICGLALQNDLVLFSGFPSEATSEAPVYADLLPLAFHLSGAKAFLYNTWEGPEATRVNLLRRFLSYAKSGFPSARALQSAKKDFIRQVEMPEFAHPYYWAAPVLQGDSSTLDLQDENDDLLQIGLGLGGLAVLIVLVHAIGVRLRRRKRS